MKKYIIITLCLMAMIARGQDIIPTMRYIQENITGGGGVTEITYDNLAQAIGDGMNKCTFHDGIQSMDFTGEPLMSAAYTKEIKICAPGSVIIEYIDCSGEDPVTVLQAVTPLEEPEP